MFKEEINNFSKVDYFMNFRHLDTSHVNTIEDTKLSKMIDFFIKNMM